MMTKTGIWTPDAPPEPAPPPPNPLAEPLRLAEDECAAWRVWAKMRGHEDMEVHTGNCLSDHHGRFCGNHSCAVNKKRTNRDRGHAA